MDSVDWWSILALVLGALIGALTTWFFAKLYYERAARDLAREAASLRHETHRVRHVSRATISWLKEAGLINPRVDPDTGEYLDVVGSERQARWNVEAAPEDAGKSADGEDQPPTQPRS